jgi:hypothetical protein
MTRMQSKHWHLLLCIFSPGECVAGCEDASEVCIRQCMLLVYHNTQVCLTSWLSQAGNLWGVCMYATWLSHVQPRMHATSGSWGNDASLLDRLAEPPAAPLCVNVTALPGDVVSHV